MKNPILENKVIIVMSKAVDLIIISLYWLVLCIPVITIIPATAALYYAAVKGVRRDRSNITREFFKAFKLNLKQGMCISGIYIVLGIMLYSCYDFARGVKAGTGLGPLYYTLTIVVSIVLAMVTLYLIPVLSRFELKTTNVFRLSLYFAARNLKTLIPLAITLGAAVAVVYCVPPFLCIIPGVYCILLSYSVEAALKKYIEENTKPEENQSDLWYME
jgi:uncharacterized membrane protein YesL